MDLFGNSTNLPERQELKGTAISKKLTRSVKRKGGDAEGQALTTDAVTRGVMGCGSKELYASTGGTPGKVETLPQDAQEALFVGKVAASHAIDAAEIAPGTQKEVNSQIANTAHKAAKKAGGLFPWNW